MERTEQVEQILATDRELTNTQQPQLSRISYTNRLTTGWTQYSARPIRSPLNLPTLIMQRQLIQTAAQQQKSFLGSLDKTIPIRYPCRRARRSNTMCQLLRKLNLYYMICR